MNGVVPAGERAVPERQKWRKAAAVKRSAGAVRRFCITSKIFAEPVPQAPKA
jgi:hypothetical protein